jgi:hypothetical protein
MDTKLEVNKNVEHEKLIKDWIAYLVNKFYTNRFAMTGHAYFSFIEKYPKYVDEFNLVRRSKYRRRFPCRSQNQMTIYGYFISTYPSLKKLMEETDEFDLLSRLKIISLVLKTKPMATKKHTRKEYNENAGNMKNYKVSRLKNEIYHEKRKASEGHQWNICK